MQPVSAFNEDAKSKVKSIAFSRDVQIPPLGLAGTLRHPAGARGLVIFAHGSGSSRFSPRNVQVADALHRRGIATLLFDLLLPEEENDRRNVFDIELLGRRLIHAVNWIIRQPDVGNLPLGLFGASTGAAAALVAASSLGDRIGAVVSRGGRPDLAGDAAAPGQGANTFDRGRCGFRCDRTQPMGLGAARRRKEYRNRAGRNSSLSGARRA